MNDPQNLLAELERLAVRYGPKGKLFTMMADYIRAEPDRISAARAEERAAVVAFLRTFSVEGHFLADAIERCDHIKGDENE